MHTTSEGGSLQLVPGGSDHSLPHHSLGVQVPPCAPALPPFSGLPITLHLPPPNFFSSSLPSPGVSDHHRGSRKTALGLSPGAESSWGGGGGAGRGVSLPPHSPATLVGPQGLSPEARAQAAACL